MGVLNFYNLLWCVDANSANLLEYGMKKPIEHDDQLIVNREMDV